MKNQNLVKQIFNRQCNEKCKFSDCDALIKKMQCSTVRCFSNLPAETDLQNHDVPISTCKFSCKNKDVAALANENGLVYVQNVKNLKEKEFVQAHKNTVYDIAWMPQNSQFVTVSGDNSAKLWDCTESNVNLISIFKGHKRSVRCVSFKPENTAVFATGSRDGSLMLWDVRAQKKCSKFSHHLPDQVIPSGAGLSPASAKCGVKKGQTPDLLNCKSVTGIVFQNDNTLISCGSLDNIIRVWDMRKTYSRSTSNSVPKHQLYSPYSGFSYLCMNSAQSRLFTNCMDSYIYCFNINSYDPEPVAAFYGHENGSFYIKSSVSFDGTYLLSGSSDETAYIWNTRGAEVSHGPVKPFVTLSSHLAEVTCVEMSPDNLVVVTCSDDGTFRLWDSLAPDSGDEVRRIDKAKCYDVECISTVKTQWKNKRKYDSLFDEKNQGRIDDDGSPHSKICRFYSMNLASTCICDNKTARRTGIKRLNEDLAEGINPAKRKAILVAQEHTPPKHGDQKLIVKPEFVRDVSPETHSPLPVRLFSKRKLEDMPNFIEESNKNKRMNCNRVLAPCNVEENTDRNKSVRATPDELKKCSQSSECDGKQKENRTNKSLFLGTSSPTSNLPNYIEDGSSPYIHRCSRIVQKENDWLTKLKEMRRQEKTSSQQSKSLPQSSTNLSEQQKRKLKQSEQTLHKYFKVSSKTTEKSLQALQDLQKKGILIK